MFFWECRWAVDMLEGPLPLPVTPVVLSSSSSGVVDECAAEREYFQLMATGPSNEELLEWVLRSEPEEFAPPGIRGTLEMSISCCCCEERLISDACGRVVPRSLWGW